MYKKHRIKQKIQWKTNMSLKIILLSVLVPFTLCSVQPAYSLEFAEEYEIKSVYLFNLGEFIQWPKDKIKNNFEICILGYDWLGENLDFIATTQKTIQKADVIIKRIQQTDETENCHIVFISKSEESHLHTIMSDLKNKPILTVSDNEDFITQGGMIQFYLLDSRIRLMLDPQTIQESGLKASAQLMSVSRLVEHNESP